MKHVFPDKSGENKETGSNVYLIGLEDPHYPNTYQVFISSWKSPTETISGYELSSSSITSWTGKNVIVLNEREVGYLVNVMSRVNSTMRLDSPTGVFQLDLKENPIPLKIFLFMYSIAIQMRHIQSQMLRLPCGIRTSIGLI